MSVGLAGSRVGGAPGRQSGRRAREQAETFFLRI
jgi:hypothetical protein